MTCEVRPVSLARLFEAYDQEEVAHTGKRKAPEGGRMYTAMERHMSAFGASAVRLNGHKRLRMARDALAALDRQGWARSYHQRMFHEEYLKSTARIFFKTDGPGAFAREHSRLLDINGWDSTPQEVLVSTPRRFGKTISVSMFAAAMVYACPSMELSIYSTCKRISAKLLRNIVKFLNLIYKGLGVPPYKIKRQNQVGAPLPLLLSAGAHARAYVVAGGGARHRPGGRHRHPRVLQLPVEDR